MSLKNLNVIRKNHKLLADQLNNKKIYKLYKKFKNNFSLENSFSVGVSGGPDSLALAFFSKIYSLEKKLVSNFFIVDHGLRKNSAIEANKVKKLLSKFSIKAKILKWHGKKPSNNIQSIARKNRYNLLIKETNNLKSKNILLGHHLNDQIENFLIRLTRGSGLRGLVSFGKLNKIDNMNIYRPLINFRKEDLVYVAKNVFKSYVNDPSNLNIDFKRVRIRNLFEALEKEGFDYVKFLNTLNNLQNSNEFINFSAENNLMVNSYFSLKRKLIILNNSFFNQSQDIVFRSLSICLNRINKKQYYVRGKKLMKLIDEIGSKNFKKTTLGGCIIKKVSQTVIISAE